MGTLRNVPTFGDGRGTLGTLIRRFIFDVGTLGTFTPASIFDCELPPLHLVKDARSADAQLPVPNVEHPVAHPRESDAQPGPLRALSAVAERQWRLAGQRDFVEVLRADLRGAMPVPPRRDEHAPRPAFGVGRLVHLVEVGEEAGHAGDLDDAAHHLGPVLEAAESLAMSRSAGGDPGAAQRQAGGDEPAPVGPHPVH